MRSQTLPFTGANSRRPHKPAIAFESSRKLGGFGTDESSAESSISSASARRAGLVPSHTTGRPHSPVERFD